MPQPWLAIDPADLVLVGSNVVVVLFALWCSLSAVRLLRRSLDTSPTPRSERPAMRCEPLRPCSVARITYPSLHGLEVRELV